ncbi:flagellar assembly protein FliW [Motilibacter aurantiacus]|uniref:flagellar assembly protein FliW n=1 Tax=Motilibacter aurantiacus TaxID=2714955 RepID=UPI002F2B6909
MADSTLEIVRTGVGHDGRVDAQVTATSPAQQELPSLEFPSGLPGFPEARHFALVRLDDAGTAYSLRSLEHEELRFVVMPPGLFFPDYAPEIDDEAATELGLDAAEDALVLLVVTPGETVEQATVNLMAPVVVNLRSHRATQVVLTGSDLPLRAPLA